MLNEYNDIIVKINIYVCVHTYTYRFIYCNVQKTQKIYKLSVAQITKYC